MLRLIPKIEIEKIPLKPERDVARALVNQLPDGCTIYHSYPWLKTDRNDYNHTSTLQQGETDFIVVHPDHGLLIIEVKGGEIEYNPSEMEWYRKIGVKRKQITNPFEQARRNMHFLVEQIQEISFLGKSPLPFTYGYAVVFPDCIYEGSLPPDAEPVIVVSAKDMSNLGRAVTKAFRQWDRRTHFNPMDRRVHDGIIKGIHPSFKLIPLLSRQIEEQEEQLVRLTEEQLRLLDFLISHDRALIRGVAGSGKTLLAMSQAHRFADKGLSTLFVCYNKALAIWLNNNLSEQYSELITIKHFHALCHDLCKMCEIPFDVPSEKDQDVFWRDTAPELLMQSSEKCDTRFDAIVIDEGQDFHELWWAALESIQKKPDDGPLYVFYDPAQNLFVDKSNFPNLGEAFELPTNCRNTKKIASFCGQIQHVEIPTRALTPDGVDCSIEFIPNSEKQVKRCEQLIRQWVGQGNMRLSQIAILSPHSHPRSCLHSVQELAGRKLTLSLDQWRNEKGILFSTIRSFKGLEADAVILTDVPDLDSIPHFTRNDFYVAVSRAKHLLVVLAKNKAVKSIFTMS